MTKGPCKLQAALAGLALLLLLGGCATAPAVVVVSRHYDPTTVFKVAVAGFADFPSSAGSGEMAASTFEKYLLLGGYRLIGHQQAEQELNGLPLSGSMSLADLRKAGQALGVDALVFGSVTDYSDAQETTVMTAMPMEQSTPILGTTETVQRNGNTVVRTTQETVSGYAYSQTSEVVPETSTTPAHVGLSVRMVDAQTGEVLWTASGDSQAAFLSGATEQAAAKIMQAVLKQAQPAH
jgi:hypothetical protein